LTKSCILIFQSPNLLIQNDTSRQLKHKTSYLSYKMKKTKMLKGSLDEMQERISKYVKEKREEHQRLIMMVKDANDRGLSVREIAPLVGNVHPATVHRWLKEARQLEANNEPTKSLLQSAREEEAKRKMRPPE